MAVWEGGTEGTTGTVVTSYQPLSLRVREGRVERINARKEGAL
jgi:hypothetical protein